MAVIQAAFTMLVVSWPCYLVLRELFGDDGRSVWLASVVLGATAACTAQTALAMIGREFKLRGAPVMGLLRYISSVDAVVALIVLGFAMCLMHAHPVVGRDPGVGLQWFALSLCIGTAMGFLLHLLTQVRCSEEELLIFVVGTVAFSSGIALYLELSPLFINAIMGLLAANLPGSKDRIFNLLSQLEKPFYVVFLILAGAIWRLESPWALLLAALYLGLRLLGKIGGGYLAARMAPEESRPPLRLGLGLVSQGGIAVAMVMSYYQLSSAEVTSTVVTTVLIAVILNELASPSLARGVLLEAGEVEP
jgi:Kef-type K+ transport system membrane component KefB